MIKVLYIFIALAILTLIAKYLKDLKRDKYLSIILLFLAINPIGIIISQLFNVKVLLVIGAFGFFIALVMFLIRVMTIEKNTNNNLIRSLMIIILSGYLLKWIFMVQHWKGAGLISILMIIPLLAGLILILKKSKIPETKPMNIILIFLFIEILSNFLK